ncbi:MAG: arginine--tRNA ligase [Candidatus Hepatoplasma vulgare]|nr:MAG: arginine--tRNA ligase [Candidatus Hepatoplasma sp.]
MKKEIIDILVNYFDEKEKYYPKIEIFKINDKNDVNYSTNLALKLSSDLLIPPIKLAKNIKIFLEENYKNYFEEISITNPGFLNFKLNQSFITKKLVEFANKEYVPNLNLKDKYINYEFVSANPTGNLHIGHARNAVVGDIYINTVEYLKQKIVREYYINDAGNQIINLANSVFYYYERLVDPSLKENLNSIAYHGSEIIEYANILFNESKEYKYDYILGNAKEHFLKEIEKTLENLGLKKFEVFTSEQKLFDDKKVDKFFEIIKKTPHYFEKDGASWLQTSLFGDDKDRVLRKSNNALTYMVADVANHIEKYNRGFDLMINLWGMDHHGYEKRVKAALDILGYDSKKLIVDYISMVKIAKNGEEVKMSKRKGNALTINETLEMIGKNILRFNMISKLKEQNLVIEIDEINNKNLNNPYWYTQYVNARIFNLFKKYKLENTTKPLKKSFKLIFSLKENKEFLLIKKMLEFDYIIDSVYKNREPNILLNYLKEMASVFHSYYSSYKIISKDDALTKERVSLIILFNNLYQRIYKLLGIDIIENM